MAIRYAFFGTLVFTLITNLFGAQPAVQTQSAVMTVPSNVTLSGDRPIHESQAMKSSQNILSDTFEGGFPNQWELFSASSTLWGQTSYRAAGGSNSVYCAGGGSPQAPQGGPYFNDMRVWMIYGPFSLSDAISVSVNFDLWMKTEPATGTDYNDYLFYGFSLDGSQFSGFNTAGNTQGWDPRSFDDSEITSIEILGESEVWFAIGFFSNPTITDEGAYIDNVSLTKTTADPCTLSCSANAPASGLAGVPVNFTAQATADNCSTSPTYTWNFGDNSQNSTAQNPTHSYAAGGSFSWSMLASVDGQTCQKTGVISITGASANYNHEYWVPAAAHAAGNLGSQWRTDLGVFNPGSATTSLRVDFHDSGTIRTLTRSLSPGSSVLLNDVIGLYNVNSSGALEILTDQEVFVTSRTYNEGNAGSFGQFLDGTDPAMALLSGQSATLPQLREDAAFRTNIGLLNTSATNAIVKVELFDGNGTSLQSFNRTLTPGVLRQENQPFSALAGRSNIVRGSAVITVVSGSGVIAYGSVIDNQTQDPTTIPMKGGATEIRQGWVAAAAHAAGSLGSQWRTDLGLLNRQASAALVTVRMHEGGNTYNLPVSINPGDQAVLADVVGMIGVNASGSLEISSDVPLYITSRTYNQGSAGSFGQFLDGYSPDASIGVGQTV